eukprot:1490641-Alexandrium_andersonii.AAC.1
MKRQNACRGLHLCSFLRLYGCIQRLGLSSGGATRTTALGQRRVRPLYTAVSALRRCQRFPVPPLRGG